MAKEMDFDDAVEGGLDTAEVPEETEIGSRKKKIPDFGKQDYRKWGWVMATAVIVVFGALLVLFAINPATQNPVLAPKAAGGGATALATGPALATPTEGGVEPEDEWDFAFTAAIAPSHATFETQDARASTTQELVMEEQGVRVTARNRPVLTGFTGTVTVEDGKARLSGTVSGIDNTDTNIAYENPRPVNIFLEDVTMHGVYASEIRVDADSEVSIPDFNLAFSKDAVTTIFDFYGNLSMRMGKLYLDGTSRAIESSSPEGKFTFE